MNLPSIPLRVFPVVPPPSKFAEAIDTDLSNPLRSINIARQQRAMSNQLPDSDTPYPAVFLRTLKKILDNAWDMHFVLSRELSLRQCHLAAFEDRVRSRVLIHEMLRWVAIRTFARSGNWQNDQFPSFKIDKELEAMAVELSRIGHSLSMAWMEMHVMFNLPEPALPGDTAQVAIQDEFDLIPPLTASSDEWLNAKGASVIAGITVGRMANSRLEGRTSSDGMCGVDSAGRQWRKYSNGYTAYFVPSVEAAVMRKTGANPAGARRKKELYAKQRERS